MKKIYTIIVAVLLTASVFAQAPEKMTYQAVVRDGSSTLITSTQVGIEINIYQTTASGTLVYSETQTPTTNVNGLLSIEIGGQTGFDQIDWANGPYFIETNIDVAGGTNYTITGVSQLLTVPYALHAKTAESITGTITETDPTYTSSQAANITAGDITNLSNLSNTNSGDQDISGITTNTQAIQDTASQIRADIPDISAFISTETDPIYTSSQAANITAGDITNLSNLSNTNSGDQDISGITTNTQAIQDTASQIRADIPDVSAFISTETDPIYTSSQAANITASDITNLSNLSNTNSGDQDISGITINTQAIQDTASQIRADIPDVSGFISTETDPIYTSSQAANITAGDITNLSNLSNTNSGDQTISRTGLTVTLTNGGTYQDSINTYIAGAGIIITNNVVKTMQTEFYLGQDTLGGIVYYIYLGANGEQHGLIVSKTETTAIWQNTEVLVNADRTEDGNYNTNLMSDSPAKDSITTNFDSNWYLPSIDELSLLWHNRFFANKALRAGGFTLLTYNDRYWSSMEYSTTIAFSFDFQSSYPATSGKAHIYRVRAVRAF